MLLFDYPQELRTNQELVAGMYAFFQKLGIENPVFVGASDGGMVAQIYVQKYPGETGGLVLISTGGMDKNTLTTVMIVLTSWGRLWLMSWRRVSISLV